jgi:hypothetical protein
MKRLVGAVVLLFAFTTHADCNDMVSACMQEAGACANSYPSGDTCSRQAKACVLRIKECDKAYKSYIVRLLDCSESGRSFEQCRKTVKPQ